MKLTIKQTIALDYLEDSTTTELLFGGGAGGAKSVLGCYWALKLCLKYPGIRGLICRTVAKTLKETTLATFWWVCKEQNLQRGHHFKYSEGKGLITFWNGSEILLKDAAFKPEDTEFDRFGSLEIAFAFFDEVNQGVKKAWETIKSRLRHPSIDQYGLIPKMLGTCNPAKNWVYMTFFSPWRKGELQPYRRFVQALLKDNPYASQHYRKQLETLDDPAQRQRLLFGNWDYEDDPLALCQFDAIADMFTNSGVKGGDRAISADLAMQGRARFVALYWEGLRARLSLDQPKSTGKSIETDLAKLMKDYGVGRSKTIVDSDGLGQYLESYLIGIKEFHGGSAAFDPNEYMNLKAECAFMLASAINKRELFIEEATEEQRERIAEELSICLKRDTLSGDEKKKRLLPKKDMVDQLGRSPDYLDALLMGMYFHRKVDGRKSNLQSQAGFFG